MENGAITRVEVEPVIAETIYRGGQKDIEAYAKANRHASVNFIHDHPEHIEKFTHLRREAAHSFMDLQAEWCDPRNGGQLLVSDMLRTVAVQIDLKKRKPRLAARPGNSLHGHGLAVDYDISQLGRNPANGHKYNWKDFDKFIQGFGWKILERAYSDGGKEAWHMEYRAYPPHPFNKARDFIDWMDDRAIDLPIDVIMDGIMRVAVLAGYNGDDYGVAIKEVQKLARLKVDGVVGPITRQAVARLDFKYYYVDSTYKPVE